MSDSASETNLDEDELNLLTEYVFGPQNKKTLKYLSETVKQNFAILDERDRELLKMRYGFAPYSERHTFEEVCEAMRITTRERVRQMEQRALARLRAGADTSVLDLFED